MGLFGQGRPIAMLLVRGGLVVMLAAACAFSCAVASYASELDVRLRFAWGSGGQSPQKWTGKITVAGATLSELQPLGIEADEAAALRLVGNEIRVTPLVRRAFDGCDVTVQGNEAAIVKVELQCSPDAAPKVIEAPLGQVAKEQFRATLDDLGGDLLIHRAPGDRLRVHFDRPHLVFNPAEELNLNVAADLKGDAGDSPITVVATLRRVGEDKIIKQLQAPYDPATNAPIAFALEAPSLEGAYRISLAAQRKTGLAGRLVPWEKNNVIASREVEFVVVDPEARLPRLTDAWETVATIGPAPHGGSGRRIGRSLISCRASARRDRWGMFGRRRFQIRRWDWSSFPPKAPSPIPSTRRRLPSLPGKLMYFRSTVWTSLTLWRSRFRAGAASTSA
jgi:hypothetical protein